MIENDSVLSLFADIYTAAKLQPAILSPSMHRRKQSGLILESLPASVHAYARNSASLSLGEVFPNINCMNLCLTCVGLKFTRHGVS